MNVNSRPTEQQIARLESIYGREAWVELCRQREFQAALRTSLQNCRRLALRYLARKERSPELQFAE